MNMGMLISGFQYLVLVGIVSFFLLVIIIGVTVAILKLIDKSKKREASQRQLLADTTQAYYDGTQMTMRPMYTQQRAEMVPDILENSLPRPPPLPHPHMQAQYAPASESSYGTNYPGTMYYMGPQNQGNPVRVNVDYDCVTLPKKPETVSDSESEEEDEVERVSISCQTGVDYRELMGKKPHNYDAGKAMRTKVLGEKYVSKAVADPNDFAAPLQDIVTSHAWGTVWTREELPPKIRSIVTVSMLIALNRPNELKLHMRGALNNGVTPEELREIIIHGSVYCGFPAAMDSMRHAKALLEELAAE